MKSYELQQLYNKKRKNKTTARQGQTKTQATTPNQHKQQLHIVKRPKRKICGNCRVFRIQGWEHSKPDRDGGKNCSF